MTNNFLKSEAGFSLIELLIALSIFAVGLLGTAGMQLTALQSNAGAHKITTINTVAAGVMEEILTWAPDDPKLIDVAGNPHSWDFDLTTIAADPLTVIGGGTFTARYNVQTNVPIGSVSTITLTVTSTAGSSAWGGNSRVLTCLKKTQ